MAKAKTKGKIRSMHVPVVDIRDWRVSCGIGFLFGIVICKAAPMIGTMLLLGAILLTIKLVDKNRI